MNELASNTSTAQSVARRTFRGAVAIGIRQLVVQGTRILGGVFLARLLSPGEFGFYAIILYFQTFLTAFGDAGLAASLVRQHEEPQTLEFRSIFTIQQILVSATSILLWLLSSSIASWYHLKPHDAWMFRLIAVSFFATSFMVVPQVLLERHLAFNHLAVIESAQAIVFNVLSVYFSWRGLGAYSFVWALLLRSIVGVVLANYLSPWKIGWHWDWALVRSHLSFGLSYQGIQVTSLLKDSITPVFIGILLGPSDVGFVTWASIVAAYPVMALLVLQRLYMPSFARLQHNHEQLSALVKNVIWATNVVTAPLAVLTLALIVPLTVTVYGSKWLVALPYFCLLWPANLVICSATPVMGLLNALGHSRITLLFAIIWMAGTWVIGAPLIWLYGPIGFPIATLLVQISNFWLFKVAQSFVSFRISSLVMPVWAIASLSGIAVYVSCSFRMPRSIPLTLIYGCSGLLLYGAGLCVFYKDKVCTALALLRGTE